MRSRVSWFPFCPAEFLADTYCLSAEQTGIYIRMLCLQFRECVLPNDAEQLAPLVGGKPQDVALVMRKLFTECADKRLIVNRRLADEMETAEKKSSLARELAQRRWEKAAARAKAHAEADAIADAR